MSINFERSLKAPLNFRSEVNPILVYIIAAVFAFLANIDGAFNTNQQTGNFIAQNASSSEGTIILIILGILFLLLMIIKIFFSSFIHGYTLETVKCEVNDMDSVMPGWGGNWLRFLFKGIQWNIIWFVYFIILFSPAVVVFLLGLVISGTTFTDLSSSDDLIGATFGVFIIITFALLIVSSLIMGLLLPMVFVHFAATCSFFSAFDLLTILGKIFKNPLDYIVAILIAFLFCIAAIIPMIGLCCTLIGILLIPCLTCFVLPIMYMNLFAQAYKSA